MRDLEDELDSTEITLGTGKLLGLFLGLVVICAIFFSLGYALGKNSGAIQPQMVESPATLAPGTTAGTKPDAGLNSPSASADASPSVSAYTPSDMAAASASAPASDVAPATKAPAEFTAAAARSAQAGASGIVVQVAAVSRREDADILINALRKKNYPVFIAGNGASSDNLFHVQVGPYTDIKQAESTKSRLANDGYTPILKR